MTNGNLAMLEQRDLLWKDNLIQPTVRAKCDEDTHTLD